MPNSFEPEVIPKNKEIPLRIQLTMLEAEMAERMDMYEEKRAGIHWKNENDNSYHHIEKAMGELAVAYTLAKYGGEKDQLLQEAADAVNHILIALDIGPEELDIDENGIRTDKI